MEGLGSYTASLTQFNFFSEIWHRPKPTNDVTADALSGRPASQKASPSEEETSPTLLLVRSTQRFRHRRSGRGKPYFDANQEVAGKKNLLRCIYIRDFAWRFRRTISNSIM